MQISGLLYVLKKTTTFSMLGLTYILTDYKIYIYRKNNKKMVDFYLKKSQNTNPMPLHQAVN